MRNRKNGGKKAAYVKSLYRWVEMNEEAYRAYQNPIDAYRKKMQYHGRCRCPKSKLWTCDADCGLCKYAMCGDTSSLDELLEGDGTGAFEGARLADFATPEEALLIKEDVATLHRLLDRLEELDPELRRICDLVMEGVDERSIASELGFASQSSVNHRKKKAFTQLREWLSEFSD